MEKQIIDFLKSIINEKYGIDVQDIKLSIPPKKEFGDYAFGGFNLSKELKKSPAIIVQDLKEIIERQITTDFFISDVNVEGQYLNIKLNNSIYTKEFLDNLKSSKNYPTLLGGESKETIIIDYIGTNVGKPLHIAHMCTPNQGQAIYNVYKRLGYNVIGDSHIGDWGIIFGKLILAFKKYGNEDKLKENAVEHLFELYVKITSDIEDEKNNYESLILEFYQKFSSSMPDSYKKGGWLKFIGDNNRTYYSGGRETSSDDNYRKKFETFINSSKDTNIEQRKYMLNKYSIYCNDLEEGIRNEFKSLSNGNPESIKLWEKFTKESIKSMNIQLSRLNVQPDFDIGESFYEGLNLPKIQNYPDLKYSMNDIVNELLEKKIAIKNDDGSVGVIFPDEIKIPSCVLQKRDGSNLYFTSDLCAIKYRVINWNVSKILYFVDVRQQLHLKQAFEIARMAGWLKKENGGEVGLFHAYNGFISLKDGAMSTRKGRIIKLDKLLDEAEIRAKNIILEKRDDISGEELEKLSKIIGIGAIKYGYLKKSRETDVIFDWDEFMTFEGNSGPYIQYAYVRAIRILEKETIPVHSSLSHQLMGKDEDNFSVFTHIDEIDLVKELLNYENILQDTAKTCCPHILAGYCYNLTKKFNAFYNNVQVISEENKDLKNLRLLLVQQFSETLKEGFNLLGIDMPDKM